MKDNKDRIKKIIMSDDFLRYYFYKNPTFLNAIYTPNIKGWKNKKIIESYEPLIALNGYNKQNGQFTQLHKRILPAPAYFMQNLIKQDIPDAIPIIYNRASLVDLLLKYIEQLPNNYGLIIYDGYRPLSVQKNIYDSLFNEEKGKNPSLTDEEIKDKIDSLVLPPVKNPNCPPQHNTGGAIDFYIYNIITGNLLDVGCEFDDFRKIAYVTYFQDKYKSGEQLTDAELKIMLNRNILINIATYIGLSIYPDEIWHLNHGTQTDSKVEIAKYGSVELSNIFLNPNNNLELYIRQNKKFSNHSKYLIEEVVK